MKLAIESCVIRSKDAANRLQFVIFKIKKKLRKKLKQLKQKAEYLKSGEDFK